MCINYEHKRGKNLQRESIRRRGQKCYETRNRNRSSETPGMRPLKKHAGEIFNNLRFRAIQVFKKTSIPFTPKSPQKT